MQTVACIHTDVCIPYVRDRGGTAVVCDGACSRRKMCACMWVCVSEREEKKECVYAFRWACMVFVCGPLCVCFLCERVCVCVCVQMT